MRRDCDGNIEEDLSEETLLQEDPPEYLNEVDSLEDTTFHFEVVQGPPSEEATRLTGKLKFLCPTLFSSLTLWERDALENSGWLFRSTSFAKGISEGGSRHKCPC